MPEEEGGGQGRIFGMHPILLIGLIAVGAYFLFFRGSGSSAGSPSTSGGGGTITSSGTTTLQKGAVTITVTQAAPGGAKPGTPPPVKKGNGGDAGEGEGGGGGHKKQPKPPVRKRRVSQSAQTDTGSGNSSAQPGGTVNPGLGGPTGPPVSDTGAGVTPASNAGAAFPKVLARHPFTIGGSTARPEHESVWHMLNRVLFGSRTQPRQHSKPTVWQEISHTLFGR